jgi:hypothetical protein
MFLNVVELKGNCIIIYINKYIVLIHQFYHVELCLLLKLRFAWHLRYVWIQQIYGYNLFRRQDTQHTLSIAVPLLASIYDKIYIQVDHMQCAYFLYVHFC